MEFFVKRNTYQLVFMFCSIFFSTAHALNGHFYLGGDIATSKAVLSNNNPSIPYYAGLLIDRYPLNHTDTKASTLSLHGGYEFIDNNDVIPNIAVGVGIYKTPTSYKFSGRVYETALGAPSTALYDYKFQIDAMRVMAETKFTWWIKNNFISFIDLGMGPAWNHQNNYQETAVPSGYVTTPAFHSNTNCNFAYQIGVGIGYAFNIANITDTTLHERVVLGFRYAHLGDSTFGIRSSNYPFSLNSGRLTTRDLYLNYTHTF